MERESRFIVAHSSGPREARLVEQVVQTTQQRTMPPGDAPISWCSDGWEVYPQALQHAYRQPVYTGRPGRPRLLVPPTVRLTQTVKHRDAHGHLQQVETRVTLGAPVVPAGTMHEERENGVLRDRLNALTRKTHAFAKRDARWDALFGLALFEHNWLHAHLALRVPLDAAFLPAGVVRRQQRYLQRSPAMVKGLTDHVWSWDEFLLTPTYVVRYFSS